MAVHKDGTELGIQRHKSIELSETDLRCQRPADPGPCQSLQLGGGVHVATTLASRLPTTQAAEKRTRLVVHALDGDPGACHIHSDTPNPPSQSNCTRHANDITNVALDVHLVRQIALDTSTPSQTVPSMSHKTPSGLVAKPDPQVSHRPAQSEFAFHSARHLHHRRLSAEEARDVRFGLLAVVRRQKHVVNMYEDHSDEMSRKVTQAEEGRLQFERFP